MSAREKQRCSQLTAKGTPCRSFVVRGSDRCTAHLGRIGRKTKLTPELQVEFLRMLSAGNYVQVACRAVGISKQTFADWMRRAKTNAPEDAEFAELAVEVERARAKGEVRNVAVIARAAQDGDWRAALAMLEREFPERWGPVSVRVREVDAPTPIEPVSDPADPFSEVDELAEKRRRRSV